jgi:hypothetical protein
MNNEVVKVVADGPYVDLYAADDHGEFVKTQTLAVTLKNWLSTRANDRYIRINRKYAVHECFVQDICLKTGRLKLNDNTELVFSRRRLAVFVANKEGGKF